MKEHEKDRMTNRTHSDDAYRASTGTPNLVKLKDTSDFKIVKEDPDVRGWAVLTADNLEIGKVDELIVDTNAMKVRYMVVDLYDDYAADKIDHNLLLPIGAARLHEKDNKVLVSGIKSTTVLNYPVYRNNEITRDYERSIRNYFDRGGIMNATAGAAAGTVAGMPPVTHTGTASTTDSDRTIREVDRDHIHGHVSDSTNVHGTAARNDIESSHNQETPYPDETTRTHTDPRETGRSLTGDEHRRSLTGEKEFGTSNFTTPSDFHDRTRTSGLSPRTDNLENKEIIQGPSGTEKTEWDAQRPHKQEGEWNDTSNLNSSTSLSDEDKRGSNLGNIENRPQYHTDRERAASPEHSNRKPGAAQGDEFYDHEHFDEEVFYRVRRRKRDE